MINLLIVLLSLSLSLLLVLKQRTWGYWRGGGCCSWFPRQRWMIIVTLSIIIMSGRSTIGSFHRSLSLSLSLWWTLLWWLSGGWWCRGWRGWRVRIMIGRHFFVSLTDCLDDRPEETWIARKETQREGERMERINTERERWKETTQRKRTTRDDKPPKLCFWFIYCPKGEGVRWLRWLLGGFMWCISTYWQTDWIFFFTGCPWSSQNANLRLIRPNLTPRNKTPISPPHTVYDNRIYASGNLVTPETFGLCLLSHHPLVLT